MIAPPMIPAAIRALRRLPTCIVDEMSSICGDISVPVAAAPSGKAETDPVDENAVPATSVETNNIDLSTRMGILQKLPPVTARLSLDCFVQQRRIAGFDLAQSPRVRGCGGFRGRGAVVAPSKGE